MNPVEALSRIAYLLERDGEPTYRVQAFRRAALTVASLPPGELEQRWAHQTLQQLPGIGKATAAVISESLAGTTPVYLTGLEARARVEPALGRELRSLLRGDLHTHSDWSDGGSPIELMALAARDLGHEYVALTDHSPRLTIANGLSAERLEEQLEVVADLNRQLAPFRILTGIEVDILDDGALDQHGELLARLDVVVASVHSKLRMESAWMTRRMVAAVSNPNVDILGHCTGRIVVGKGRPQSTFDSAEVFAACQQSGVAVEINSRPERLDPPMALLGQANELGCLFSIDTDAHAPGQLDWQGNGCERAERAGVEAGRIVNTLPLNRLLGWTRRGDQVA